jgi:hypothetical protein
MFELKNPRRVDAEVAGSLEVLTQEHSETCQEEAYDPRLERRVKWKLDATILPLLVSVQFLAQMVGICPSY